MEPCDGADVGLEGAQLNRLGSVTSSAFVSQGEAYSRWINFLVAVTLNMRNSAAFLLLS